MRERAKGKTCPRSSNLIKERDMKRILPFRALFLLCLMSAVTACTHAPVTTLAPISKDMISTEERKRPGRYALVVSADAMTGNTLAATTTCSIHTYPYDMSQSFVSLAYEATQRVVEQVDIVDTPRTALLDEYDAVIHINVVKSRAFYDLIRGLWSSDALAMVEVVSEVSLLVDGAGYTSPQLTISANHQAPLGYPCSGIPVAVGEAMEKVSHQTIILMVDSIKAILDSDGIPKSGIRRAVYL